MKRFAKFVAIVSHTQDAAAVGIGAVARKRAASADRPARNPVPAALARSNSANLPGATNFTAPSLDTLRRGALVVCVTPGKQGPTEKMPYTTSEQLHAPRFQKVLRKAKDPNHPKLGGYDPQPDTSLSHMAAKMDQQYCIGINKGNGQYVRVGREFGKLQSVFHNYKSAADAIKAFIKKYGPRSQVAMNLALKQLKAETENDQKWRTQGTEGIQKSGKVEPREDPVTLLGQPLNLNAYGKNHVTWDSSKQEQDHKRQIMRRFGLSYREREAHLKEAYGEEYIPVGRLS